MNPRTLINPQGSITFKVSDQDLNLSFNRSYLLLMSLRILLQGFLQVITIM